MGNDPAAVSSELETKAVSWPPLRNDVGRVVPPNRTIAPETKPEPFTVKLKPLLPCCTELGLRLLMIGTTRLEIGFTVNVSGLEVTGACPLSCVTVTGTAPAAVRS